MESFSDAERQLSGMNVAEVENRGGVSLTVVIVYRIACQSPSALCIGAVRMQSVLQHP